MVFDQATRASREQGGVKKMMDDDDDDGSVKAQQVAQEYAALIQRPLYDRQNTFKVRDLQIQFRFCISVDKTKKCHRKMIHVG